MKIRFNDEPTPPFYGLKVLVLTQQQYLRSRIVDIAEADAIVVDNIIKKNRYGKTDIFYKGSIGDCRWCNKPWKKRMRGGNEVYWCECK